MSIEAPDKAAMEKEDVQILKASSQSTIQYRHRPRSPTELSVPQMSANRPGAFASTTGAY